VLLDWLPSLLLVLLEHGASLLVVVVVVVVDELSLALLLLSTISSPIRGLLSIADDELLKTLTEHSEMLLLFPWPFSAPANEGTFSKEEGGFNGSLDLVVSMGGMVLEVLAEEEEVAFGWTMPIFCCCCFWWSSLKVEMLSFTFIFVVVFRDGGCGG